MSDDHFGWLSKDECRDIKELLNCADSRIAIFDTGLFDHRENESDEMSFIFEMNLEYPPKLHERDDDYPLTSKIMTIEP